MDLYFFDFDKTLYAYDFRQRLPALARITGASQYHLAKAWWAGGYEARAEAGAWRTAHEYLEKFAEVTGYPLSLDEWCEAREAASSAIPGSVEALRRCATLGTVSLFSNNPSPFGETLERMAPDVAEVLGENALVSYQLGARKPDEEANLRALRHYGARPEDVLFIDDSRANVAAAATLGMQVHHFLTVDGVPQVDALNAAIDRFARRNG